MDRHFFEEENARLNWRDYIDLTRLYPYQNLQTQIIKAYTPYSKFVEKYCKLMKIEVSPVSHEYLQKNPEVTTNNIELLKNAIQLWKDAFSSNESIAPILHHYCFHCFISFFNYTLFRWNPKHTNSHGVYISKWIEKDENILDIELCIAKNGLFQRFVDTWILLGGCTAFSQYIPIKREDLIFIENKEYILKKTNDLYLKELLEFNPRKFEKWIIETYVDEWIGCHCLKSSSIMQINNNLKNYIILFTASNIARYRPYLWIKILNGETEELNKFANAVNRALYDLSINNLLVNVKDIFEAMEYQRFSITH